MAIPIDAANRKPSNLSDVNRTAKHGSFAHFPGSGPVGKYCDKCAHFSAAEKKKGWGLCIKFKQLMGFKGNQIRGSSQSCKYFEVAR